MTITYPQEQPADTSDHELSGSGRHLLTASEALYKAPISATISDTRSWMILRDNI